MDEVGGGNPNTSAWVGGTQLSAQRRRHGGSRIARFRDRRGFSVEELGRRVGLTSDDLKAVETGQRGVTFECLIDIANELEVTASELVEGME